MSCHGWIFNNLHCHMILQKSFSYAQVTCLIINVENSCYFCGYCYFFQDSLRRKQNIIYLNYKSFINVFTVTFSEFNVSLVNRSIHFFNDSMDYLINTVVNGKWKFIYKIHVCVCVCVYIYICVQYGCISIWNYHGPAMVHFSNKCGFLLLEIKLCNMVKMRLSHGCSMRWTKMEQLLWSVNELHTQTYYVRDKFILQCFVHLACSSK